MSFIATCCFSIAAAAPRALYQVLEEKKAQVGTGQLFGSQHTYVMPSAGAGAGAGASLGAAR